jgi:hypothetical protein
MDGGGNWLLLLEFMGIAGLTIGLGLHQLYKIKQLDLKLRAREDAALVAASRETPQAS